MDSAGLQVLAAARLWAASGRRFALVTVASTWGSAPRPPGAWLVLRDDGRIEGSVSGGCIEDDLIRRMRAGEFTGSAPLKLSYGIHPEDAGRFGLPCGGLLELLIEPAPDHALLDDLAARLERRQLVGRSVCLTSGKVSISDARRGDVLTWDGTCLCTVHGPEWRLLIVGAGQISYYLAQMAKSLDYAVTLCEPRAEYAEAWSMSGTELTRVMPDDALLAMDADARLAVVALTHDPKLDDMVLLEALKSPAFYVGALGSRANNAKRRQRLARYFDLSEAELARLHGPVGLAIGSRTPPEIAIAIVAEMTAIKNGVLAPLQQTSMLASDLACHA